MGLNGQLKIRIKKKLYVTDMGMLRCMCGETKMDKDWIYLKKHESSICDREVEE